MNFIYNYNIFNIKRNRKIREYKFRENNKFNFEK